MKKEYIKGKDEALDVTIEKMNTLLKSHGFDIEEKSWLNPVEGIHSLHIQESGCELLFTNGKGATPQACLASALGEFFERLGCGYLFADYWFGEDISGQPFVHHPDERWFSPEDGERPVGLLSESLWRFYDPHSELAAWELFDINTGIIERGVCALPFSSQRDGEKIYFPVNILENLYVSNGMAAGNTPEEARVQALSEILERHVKEKVIKEALSLPEIPKDLIAGYPHIAASIEAIEAAGLKLKICDASLGGRYPVVNVTMIDPDRGACLASFGAHPLFEVALERSVTELLQGRTTKRREDFKTPVFEEAKYASDENIVEHFIDSTGVLSCDYFRSDTDFAFAFRDFDGDTKEQFEYLVSSIESEGYDIYIADYNHLGIDVCRILVPGMSEIYPVSDLVWSNNNEGARYRPYILTLEKMQKDEWLAILENLKEDEIDDSRNVAEFIGMAPDTESAWRHLQIGTLKTMLALAAEELDAAKDGIRWMLHFGNLTDEQKKLYRCIETLLQIEEDAGKERKRYEKGVRMLYGDETYDLANAIVDAKIRFYGLHFSESLDEVFKLHGRLLENLQKSRVAMQKACR
ncbi:30S ribosomal protein S12 methylthiotransferase accessory factor YcaO [Hydrogenimonas sp.]